MKHDKAIQESLKLFSKDYLSDVSHFLHKAEEYGVDISYLSLKGFWEELLDAIEKKKIKKVQ